MNIDPNLTLQVSIAGIAAITGLIASAIITENHKPQTPDQNEN